MLLPPKFKDEALKTLGPPIRKDQEKKSVEVEVQPGIYRVNGKLETRIPENEEAAQHPWSQPNAQAHVITGTLTINGQTSIGVSEIDIPLPEMRIIGMDFSKSDTIDHFTYLLKWSWK